MIDATCETCPYYEADADRTSGGFCHRNAPMPADAKDTPAWWPQVDNDDWCGEHPHRRWYP